MDDISITARIRKWIENPYVVKSTDSEEDNCNDDADNQEGDDMGEDTNKNGNDLPGDEGDDFTQNMNSPPRINKPICFFIYFFFLC